MMVKIDETLYYKCKSHQRDLQAIVHALSIIEYGYKIARVYLIILIDKKAITVNLVISMQVSLESVVQTDKNSFSMFV